MPVKKLLGGLIAAMLLFSGLGLSGCMGNLYGGVSVDSINKAALISAAELRATNLLLQDVVLNKLITKSRAQQALNNLVVARDALQATNDAMAMATAGGEALAQSSLAKFNTYLDIAISILAPSVQNLPPLPPQLTTEVSPKLIYDNFPLYEAA